MARTGRPISEITKAINAGQYAFHTCGRCGDVLPFTAANFARNRHLSGGLRKICRRCTRAADRHTASKRQMEWRGRNPQAYERIRRKQYYRLYGLSVEQHAQLLTQQGGRCAICRNAETIRRVKTGEVQAMHIDHCHTTGRIRGLLCSRCNLAVGHVKDSPETCRRMADYLEGAIQPTVEPSRPVRRRW